MPDNLMRFSCHFFSSSIDGDVRRSSHSSRSSMMWGSLIDKLRKKSSSSTLESLTAPNSPRSPRSPTSRAFNHFPQNLPDSEMSDVSSMCSIASSQYRLGLPPGKRMPISVALNLKSRITNL